MLEKLESCILCRSPKITELTRVCDWTAKKKGNFLLSLCCNCQIIFLSERPYQSDIAKYYRNDYQPYHSSYPKLVEAFISYRTKKEIAAFKKYNPHALRVLEIGSSFGKYLYDLKRYGGFEVTGIDLNKEMCAIGRRIYNISLLPGDLSKYSFRPKSFDIVIMSHVIEHLYDPGKTLKKVNKLLSTGGLLFIRTPNVQSLERLLFAKYWMPYEAPRHTLLFSPKTIKNLLQKYHFLVKKLYYEKSPNNLILSLKNLFLGNPMLTRWADIWNLNNYFLLVFFFPFSLLLGILKSSGRMVLIVQKTN